MSSAPYFDGSYAKPVQHGPVVPWRDPLTRSMLYTITYHQQAAKWVPMPIGTRGIFGSNLVEETNPTDTGVAGLVEWQRVFAVAPRSWKAAESYVYNLQFLNGGLFEFPIRTNSVLVYDYFHESDPETIPLLKAYKILQSGDIYYATTPAPVGAYIIAEDSEVERWRGNFWERKTRYIARPVLTVFTP